MVIPNWTLRHLLFVDARLPGYSGHIPGSKYEFSSTFGKTTEKLVSALESTDKTPKVGPECLRKKTARSPTPCVGTGSHYEHHRDAECEDYGAEQQRKKGGKRGI